MLSFEQARERFGPSVELRMERAARCGGLVEEMALYHLGTGGKRLRGILPPWLVCNMGGSAKRQVEEAISIGAALELLHNGTLVHDDLQDMDVLRRGHPTIWKRWGAAQAINLGDAFTYVAGVCLDYKDAKPGVSRAAWAAMTQVAGGQVLEFQLQLPSEDPAYVPASLDVFFRMARGKTGALFGACVETSALCMGMPTTESYRAWGEQLGLLFQVQDDYLDLVGDKGRHRAGSDIAEGKVSFPVAWTLTHADESVRTRLHTIVRAPRADTTDGMLDEGIALLAKGGGLEATRRFLLEESDVLMSAAIAGYLPGLVEKVLAPVAHAL
jgi:geranylgeranyl diphosphate synthase type I